MRASHQHNGEQHAPCSYAQTAVRHAAQVLANLLIRYVWLRIQQSVGTLGAKPRFGWQDSPIE
jgi:hypothetical protein